MSGQNSLVFHSKKRYHTMNSLSAQDLICMKMEKDGAADLAIRTFCSRFKQLESGQEQNVSEKDFLPLGDIPFYDELPKASNNAELLSQTVVLKLNGGLGTSMGLNKAKSLLPVKENLSFLEIILKQICSLRKTHQANIPLVLMNSFSTEKDSLDTVHSSEGFEAGQNGVNLSLLQNRVPKLCRDTLAPAEYPEAPEKEWCPPGHGDIYTALLTSGLLDDLIGKGYQYMFVSNSDNLGATLDMRILAWFAANSIPFLMEVTQRTAADKKGGHLARYKNGRLILRESAQCPDDETEAFQDVSRFQYFNTNNIWINLPALKNLLNAQEGILDLPLIVNKKTVNPQNPASPAVFQLETAMGGAIGVFDDAQALCVPRTRFSPVKKTCDLLRIWSDLYTLTPDYRVSQNPERKTALPDINLDDRYYKFMADFTARFPEGAPSLLACSSLTIEGDVVVEEDVTLQGDIHISNTTRNRVHIPAHSTLKNFKTPPA